MLQPIEAWMSVSELCQGPLTGGVASVGRAKLSTRLTRREEESRGCCRVEGRCERGMPVVVDLCLLQVQLQFSKSIVPFRSLLARAFCSHQVCASNHVHQNIRSFQ